MDLMDEQHELNEYVSPPVKITHSCGEAYIIDEQGVVHGKTPFRY